MPVQLPATQAGLPPAMSGHTLPQAPHEVAEEAVLTQAEPHRVWPAGHVTVQTPPPWQTGGAPGMPRQARPHDPHKATSELRSMHAGRRRSGQTGT